MSKREPYQNSILSPRLWVDLLATFQSRCLLYNSDLIPSTPSSKVIFNISCPSLFEIPSHPRMYLERHDINYVFSDRPRPTKFPGQHGTSSNLSYWWLDPGLPIAFDNRYRRSNSYHYSFFCEPCSTKFSKRQCPASQMYCWNFELGFQIIPRFNSLPSVSCL